MSLYEIIKATTQKPAEVIGKIGEIGTLKPEAKADVAIFKVLDGKFVFTDAYGNKKVGEKKIYVTKVIKDGELLNSSNDKT